MRIWKGFFALVGVVLVASYVSVGCGGSGSSIVSAVELLLRGSAAVTRTGPVTATVVGTGAPVNLPGTSISAVVPPGLTIPNGSRVAIIGIGSQLLNLRVPPGTQLQVNGTNSGVPINPDGTLALNLALPPASRIVLSIAGPTLRPINDPAGVGIAVGTLSIIIPVYADGTCGMPMEINGGMPFPNTTSRNQNITAAGMSSLLNGGTASLTVGHSLGQLSQTVRVVSGTAFIADNFGTHPIGTYNSIALEFTSP